MAHFIGYLKGNRGEVSRLGSKDSGMSAIARGWNIGASVWVGHDKEKGLDFVDVTIDGGSNGRNPSKHFKRIYEKKIRRVK